MKKRNDMYRKVKGEDCRCGGSRDTNRQGIV